MTLHPQYILGHCHYSLGFGRWHFWSTVCKWVPQGMFVQEDRNRPALQHRPVCKTSPIAQFGQCYGFYQVCKSQDSVGCCSLSESLQSPLAPRTAHEAYEKSLILAHSLKLSSIIAREPQWQKLVGAGHSSSVAKRPRSTGEWVHLSSPFHLCNTEYPSQRMVSSHN